MAAEASHRKAVLLDLALPCVCSEGQAQIDTCSVSWAIAAQDPPLQSQQKSWSVYVYH